MSEKTTLDPASLTLADEILMRLNPVWRNFGPSTHRMVVAGLVERHKSDLTAVLAELAEAMDDSSARVNNYTGCIAVHVAPEWFGKFKRALLHHAGKECLPQVPLRAQEVVS